MEFSENLVSDLIEDIRKERAKKLTNDENIMIVIKALEVKGCIIEKVYFRNGEIKPIISYARRKYKISFTKDPDSDTTLKEMCLIAAVIVFGEDILNKYERFLCVEDFLKEHPKIKEYYNRIFKAIVS